jgi:2'-5' RNA ligase
MTHYLIEFRFQGAAKKEIKRLIREVNRKFHIRSRQRPVPHITIVAPFFTRDQSRLVKDFDRICRKSPLIKFNIKGYGCFDSSKVVYINIEPSKEMIKFREDIINRIKNYCRLSPTDIFSFLGMIKVIKKYSPHATIAMKIDNLRFQKIKNYINSKEEPSKEYILVRATIIKNRIILCEYDFLLRKLLNRAQAKSKEVYFETLEKIRQINQNQLFVE